MNEDYQQRIDRVIQYIEDNLSHPINLERLAEVSNFSKYHFARIFTHTVGISPVSFVNLKRLERSIDYLTKTDKTILEISALCGFDSISTFNTAFKKHFNLTPRAVRDDLKDSNILRQVSKKQEEFSSPLRYDQSEKKSFMRRVWDMNITIKELPAYEVAYFRHVGSYMETYRAWQKLGAFSAQHKLYPPEQHFIGISLDDPSSVDEYACRYDACITIPPEFDREGHEEVQFKTLPGGLFALYQFYDTIDKFGIIYQSLFGQWLPNSEYDADDRPCLEFSMNDPAQDPERKAKIDLYIPIRKRAEA
ncbi:AraC family transcriptional regulator [Tumebacillus lipolyticus]|uniref:GyrI-like domain-containing protein n=1 Tax=Tumebacillus lipolyticus TaxID=1280370 RepID=A0ABW4ZW66_9BACL